MRALTTGPVTLTDADTKPLLYKEVSHRHLIQTPFDLPEVTEKDKAKMAKRSAKEEAAARAAFNAHQARAKEALQGHGPVIIRNAGGGGSRDLHLENFSVSNGGRELIEDANVTLAYGRRYGLIGRNGTGASAPHAAAAATC